MVTGRFNEAMQNNVKLDFARFSQRVAGVFFNPSSSSGRWMKKENQEPYETKSESRSGIFLMEENGARKW